jgi:hypothetical protein
MIIENNEYFGTVPKYLMNILEPSPNIIFHEYFGTVPKYYSNITHQWLQVLQLPPLQELQDEPPEPFLA